jgi:SAM-dependent methyltransferase
MNRFASVITNQWNACRRNSRIKSYLRTGQKPWTTGYGEYREKIIAESLNDRAAINRFCGNGELPENYGYRLDERVVELPWVFAHLSDEGSWLLDAGSALNFPYLLRHDVMKHKRIVIYTLSPEDVVRQANVSYIYGDLRHTLLREECFDEIVCISTLEHIGMNNTLLYSGDACFKENRPEDYQKVVDEFRRLLKPGGKLLLTVPYGHYQNLGWLQLFDKAMIEKVLQTFRGSAFQIVYYRYDDDRWRISTGDDCFHCTYFDIHHRQDYESDYVAAARAVACMELIK